MPRCKVYIKGEAVEFGSVYTDESALKALRENIEKGRERSKFAKDLLAKSPLSRLQLDWVHYLVKQAQGRVGPPLTDKPRIMREVGSGQARKSGSHRSNW